MILGHIVRLCVLLLFLNWLYGRIRFFKFGHFHHTQWPGKCRQVPGITIGSEDAEIIAGDLAIVSSGMCITGMGNCEKGRGAMLLFDFNKPDSPVQPVKIKWKPGETEKKQRDFNPHGISVWHQTKNPTLMVINHEPEKPDAVEIFTFNVQTSSLEHQETIYIQDAGVLNDLKATGPRSFYFTSCVYFHEILLAQAEFMLGLRLGWVGHYDGNTDSIQAVDEWLGMPNGVQMSSDGKYVYIAHNIEDAINVYRRHKNNSLEHTMTVQLHVLPDNLNIDPTDQSIWVGTASVLWKGHSGRPGPSQVLKIDVKDGIPTGKIRQVYYDNGLLAGSSSVSIYHKSKLFVGSIMDKAAFCDVNYLD